MATLIKPEDVKVTPASRRLGLSSYPVRRIAEGKLPGFRVGEHDHLLASSELDPLDGLVDHVAHSRDRSKRGSVTYRDSRGRRSSGGLVALNSWISRVERNVK